MDHFFSEPASGTVAILGGGGFVGRSLVRKLLASGYVVRVGSRKPGRDLEALGWTPGMKGRLEFFHVEVNDGAALDRFFEGAEVAVNLVSIMTPDVQALHRVNVDGARLAAVRAKQAGVRQHIHLSAIGASLTSPGRYGRSKGAAEVVVRDAFEGACLVRPSVIFGAEDKFFNLFALLAALSPVLPVYGAETRYQPVFVEDVAEALVRLIERREAGETIELGGPDVMTMKDMMAFLLDASGRRRALVSVPGWLARIQGAVLEKLPGAMMTRDQVAMMSVDNVVQSGAMSLRTLGVEPVAMRDVVPGYVSAGVGTLFRRVKG